MEGVIHAPPLSGFQSRGEARHFIQPWTGEMTRRNEFQGICRGNAGFGSGTEAQEEKSGPGQ